MINSKVVFVLGAGASTPYGYPSGPELVSNMLTLQSQIIKTLADCNFGQRQIGPFLESLKKSAQGSIDAFLERRPDLRELGKLLIASHIIRCEHDAPFYSNDDHWYPLLADKLDDPFDSLDFSNTTIITFNYDRSLEQFLFQCLGNRHNKSPDDVSRALSRLTIIHVYGHVGALDWQEPGGRGYSNHLSPDEVRRAAEGIKIIAEGRDDSPDLERARLAIASAKCVFFLGMAYHPDNMRRLGLPLKNKSGRFSGSGYRLSYHQEKYVQELYRLEHVGQSSEKCAAFLRNNPDFLRL